MKLQNLPCLILFLFGIYFCSCEDPNNDDGNTTNNNISGTWEGNWYYDFDGTIRGDCYDIIKSSVDNKIYVCGAFLEVAGNYDMKNLVRWDPATNTWEQVPGIDYYHSNFIRCVVEDDNGNLYFGGDFASIGGVTAGRVGKFDPSSGTWSALTDASHTDPNGPSSGGVYAIEYLDNCIYIGGFTFNSDSANLRYLRKYDLTNEKWEAVGNGPNYKISALCTDGTNLYAGGSFDLTGGDTVNYIAKWDGSSWSSMGEGMDNYVLALHYNDGNIYAGGSFGSVDGNITSQGIAKWTGSAWEAMANGIDINGGAETVQTICTDSDNKVYIGGDFEYDQAGGSLNHVAVFESGAWKGLGAGLGTTTTQIVMGSYADGKNIYFAGYFSKGGTDPNTKYNTAIWNENKE